jgi:hypothetical protein
MLNTRDSVFNGLTTGILAGLVKQGYIPPIAGVVGILMVCMFFINDLLTEISDQKEGH